MSDADNPSADAPTNTEAPVPEEEAAPVGLDFSRWTPRVASLDATAGQACFEAVCDYFTRHMDERDYRNLDAYMNRAHLGFALGGPIGGVADDLFMAARCLHDRTDLHLSRHPNKKFLTRRVMPVELGLVSGQPLVTQEMAIHYGMPLTLFMADEAPEDVFKEAQVLTTYFMRGSCTSHRDLAGLGALCWAGAIAAIGRGFDDEALLAINLFAEASKPFAKIPAGNMAPTLRRYDGLLTSLHLLIAGRYDELGLLLADVISTRESEQASKLGERWSNPTAPPPAYMDTSVVSILAMAALRQVAVPLPDSGPAAGYRDLVAFFATAPARLLEVPEIDAQTRALLKQAGMDPDQIEADLKEQSEANQIALQQASQAAHQATVERAPTTEAATADEDSP